MLNITNNNTEILFNYIKKVAKKQIDTADITNVYTGTIVAAASGKYTVNLSQSDSSSNVYAISMTANDVYEKDDYI